MSATFVQAIITYAHEMYLDRQGNVSALEHQVGWWGGDRGVSG